MFLKPSRYYNQKTIDVVTSNGNVKALSLRKIPVPNSTQKQMKGNDKLDMLAFTNYDISTHFWHICDANSKSDPISLNQIIQNSKKIMVPNNEF